MPEGLNLSGKERPTDREMLQSESSRLYFETMYGVRLVDDVANNANTRIPEFMREPAPIRNIGSRPVADMTNYFNSSYSQYQQPEAA